MNAKLFGIVNLLLIIAAVSLYSGATDYLQQDNTYSDTKTIQHSNDNEVGLMTGYDNDVGLEVPASLTENQALNIALADAQVQAYLESSEYETSIYYDSYGTWVISFYLSDSVVDVFVDDATETVIDVMQYSNDWNTSNATLIADAIAFVESNSLFATFADYDFVWDGYEFAGVVSIYGYDYDAWVAIDLQLAETGNFSVIDAYASVSFGNPVHTFVEATDIALNSELAKNFTSSVDNYTLYTTLIYSGGNYYYSVEFFEAVTFMMVTEANTGTGWLSLFIDDATGNIISSDGTAVATMNESEVIAIVLADPVTQTWLEQVSNYEVYAYYDGYGYWDVSLYDIQSYYNYVYAEVDDDTGTIAYIDSFLAEPAQLTESEVLQIANNTGLTDFLSAYTDAEVYVWYDGVGTWDVYAYSSTYIEASVEIIIDDTTGNVLNYYYSAPLIPATLSTTQVLTIVQSTANYTEFMNTHENVEVYIYYYNGSWYVDLWDTQSYNGLSFVVDDATSAVTDIYNNSGCYMDGSVPPKI